MRSIDNVSKEDIEIVEQKNSYQVYAGTMNICTWYSNAFENGSLTVAQPTALKVVLGYLDDNKSKYPNHLFDAIQDWLDSNF